jgi:hypothetical protein
MKGEININTNNLKTKTIVLLPLMAMFLGETLPRLN